MNGRAPRGWKRKDPPRSATSAGREESGACSAILRASMTRCVSQRVSKLDAPRKFYGHCACCRQAAGRAGPHVRIFPQIALRVLFRNIAAALRSKRACDSEGRDMASKSQEPVIDGGSLRVGDRVVYPNQGICRITGVETKNIAGQNWEVVTLSREEDGATVMVPKAKVMGIGLRKVADVAAIDRVFDELASPNNDPQLDWKVRHRENADRMTGGGLFGTVEVLKSLHALSRVRPLPAKERELYDNARHLLVGEIGAAMNIPLHVAEDNLDYALWPPEGMKRKGQVLPPATLGPPAPLRAADDLGFEDDETAEEAAPAVAAPAAAEPDDSEEAE